jgi:hypothetical protein
MTPQTRRSGGYSSGVAIRLSQLLELFQRQSPKSEVLSELFLGEPLRNRRADKIQAICAQPSEGARESAPKGTLKLSENLNSYSAGEDASLMRRAREA